MYFSFDFVWYTIHIDIFREEHTGKGEVLLNRRNPLSVTKVICRPSLSSLSSLKLLVLTFFMSL